MNTNRSYAGTDASHCLSMKSLIPILVFLLLTGLQSGCETGGATSSEQRYAFWPKPPSEPRVQFLTSFSKASDVRISRGSGKLDELLYGKQAQDDLPIIKPYGVAYWDGRIYVTDLKGGGIVVLDLKKRETRVMGSKGENAIKYGVDICVGPDGTKYVADMHRKSIMVYDAEERFVKAYASSELTPVGIAIYGDNLYVSDMTAQTVKVLDVKTGQIKGKIGSTGGEDGQFIRPLAVTTDRQGNIYVTDVLKCRIQKFSPSGELLLAFGQTGNRAGDFVRPKYMGVASDGTMFITDAAFSNIQAFDPQGLVVGYFGSVGNFPGAMDLPAGLTLVENPADMALFASYLHADFEAERIIIMTNQFGPHKVAVYAVGHVRAGRSLANINSSRIEIKEEVSDRSKSPDVTTTQPIDLDKAP